MGSAVLAPSGLGGAPCLFDPVSSLTGLIDPLIISHTLHLVTWPLTMASQGGPLALSSASFFNPCEVGTSRHCVNRDVQGTESRLLSFCTSRIVIPAYCGCPMVTQVQDKVLSPGVLNGTGTGPALHSAFPSFPSEFLSVPTPCPEFRLRSRGCLRQLLLPRFILSRTFHFLPESSLLSLLSVGNCSTL